MPDSNRDLVATTPARAGMLDFHHPEMQQCLLDLATESGADLLRPAEVVDVTPGDPPSVTIRSEGSTRQLTSRLVIGADGRNSRVRAMCNFDVERDPDWVTVAGTLYRDMRMPDDAVQMVINPNDQATVYRVSDRRRQVPRLRRLFGGGASDTQRCARCRSLYRNVAHGWRRRPTGFATPFASDRSPRSTRLTAGHRIPIANDVVLIGDAAAASDPVWGSGLSLTLRDARVLRDHLLANADWRAAADGVRRGAR